MNRLEIKAKQLKKAGKKALVAYITAGYPDMKFTEEAFAAIAGAGADVIELGVPFSDPIADGPTIQYSSYQALRKGANLDRIFSLVARVRKSSETPVILMGYLNPLLALGLDTAARLAKKSGADGFIIPDVIPEESGPIRKVFAKYGLSLVFLAPPNASSERLRELDRLSSGFVYIVSLTGVTGGRKKLPETAVDFLKRTKRHIRKPRFIGFGISRPEQAAELRKYADGVIIGSALIDIIRKNGRPAAKRKLAAFISAFRKALN